MDLDAYSEPLPIPRGGIRLPLELQPPPGFRPEAASTWPKVPGRLEYAGGRLLYMPPCGEQQGRVVASIAGLLEAWSAAHPEFAVSTNEAGMLLAGEVRAADAAIWRAAGAPSEGFARIPPL